MSKLSELRTSFEARLRAGVPDPPGDFEACDLERLKSDKYLHRVLEHVDHDVQAAQDMLWNMMAWRKTERINQINERTINMEYLKEGLFFPRGRDIDSCLIFIMKSKKYVKGQKDNDALKRVIIYWLDRLEREEDGKKLTIFFDMEGCSLSNMDMDIIMYMITLFKHYYPNFVNYLIVYQLPWILSAGFRIVRSVLPAKAVERLKTINKDKLKELVAPEQALTCWGGKDDYVFEFVPEARNVETAPKKVTFLENCDHSPGEMLSLSTNVVTFKAEGEDLSGEFTIKNMDESALSFKIRTTSPEKYRVRPSSGVLAIGATQTIQIIVQPGFHAASVNKDRFLVLALQIPKIDISPKDLSDLWHGSSKSKVDEYRLKCQSSEREKADSTQSNQPEPLLFTLKKLQSNYIALEKNVKALKIYQFITIVLMIIGIVLAVLLIYKQSKNGHCAQI